jgi:hypothetical protein
VSRELGTVVRADIVGYSAADEQIAQSLQQVLAGELPRHINRQALSRVLIDDHQHPKRTAVGCPIRHEVIAPDVIPVARS